MLYIPETLGSNLGWETVFF